jgi:hypothetical protein
VFRSIRGNPYHRYIKLVLAQRVCWRNGQPPSELHVSEMWPSRSKSMIGPRRFVDLHRIHRNSRQGCDFGAYVPQRSGDRWCHHHLGIWTYSTHAFCIRRLPQLRTIDTDFNDCPISWRHVQIRTCKSRASDPDRHQDSDPPHLRRPPIPQRITRKMSIQR